MIRKRGISPIIATVLLVSMVIILAIIIFMWLRGFTGETITKFGDENIELACGKVEFDASYTTGSLTVSNGNVPIYRLKVKVSRDGAYSSEDLPIGNLDDEWPKTGLSPLGVVTVEGLDFSGASEIELMPVLVGNSDEGKRTYICEQNTKTITF